MEEGKRYFRLGLFVVVDRRDPGRGALRARRPKALPADVHLRDLLQRIGRRPRARCAGALPRRAARSGLRDPDFGGHLRERRPAGQAQGIHRGPGEGQPVRGGSRADGTGYGAAGEEGVARPDPARGHHRSAVSRDRLPRPGEIPSARVPVDPEVPVRARPRRVSPARSSPTPRRSWRASTRRTSRRWAGT